MGLLKAKCKGRYNMQQTMQLILRSINQSIKQSRNVLCSMLCEDANICATSSVQQQQHSVANSHQKTIKNLRLTKLLCVNADMCASSATTSAPCGKYTPEDDQESVNDDGYGCPAFPAGSSCSQFTGMLFPAICIPTPCC